MGQPISIPEFIYLLRCIRKCPTGEKLARGFIELNQKSSIAIKWADPKELPSECGGSTLYNGTQTTILLARLNPLDLVAPLLVHELTHALDSDYLASYPEEVRLWSVFKTQADEAIRRSPEQNPLSHADYRRLKELHERAHLFYRNRLFQTERKAFLSTYYWIQEMKIRLPTFQKTLKILEANGYELDRWKSEDQTREKYQLK